MYNYCLAPFLYDTRKKKLMPNLIPHYFKHFAHAVQFGSVRIHAIRYAEEIEVTAW